MGPSYGSDLVKTVMRRNKPGFAACIEEVPSFGPRGTLRFTIDTEGRVQKASWVPASQGAQPDAAQLCVLRVLRAMKFVPPRGPVQVTYPWNSNHAW